VNFARVALSVRSMAHDKPRTHRVKNFARSAAIWAAVFAWLSHFHWVSFAVRYLAIGLPSVFDSSPPTSVWGAVVGFAPFAIVYALGRRYERARTAAQLVLCASICLLPLSCWDLADWLSAREVFPSVRGCVIHDFAPWMLLPEALLESFGALRAPLRFDSWSSCLLLFAVVCSVVLFALWQSAKLRAAIVALGVAACLGCAAQATAQSFHQPAVESWVRTLPSVAHIDMASIDTSDETNETGTRVGLYRVGRDRYDAVFETPRKAQGQRHNAGHLACEPNGAIEVRELTHKFNVARCIDSQGAHRWYGVGIGDGWGQVWRAHIAARIGPPIEWSILAFAGLALGATFACAMRRARPTPPPGPIAPTSIAPYRETEPARPSSRPAPADTRKIDQLAIFTLVMHAGWPVLLWALVRAYFPQM
jgi:FtsH-binding integral membrane protein